MNVIYRYHLFVHFRISSSLSFRRQTKRHVFLLLFVLTPVHLNWLSYATGKCYRSPPQLISTMKLWWLYISIHSLTIFKWKTRNLRLNLIYLSFFAQYILYYVPLVYTPSPSFDTVSYFVCGLWRVVVIRHLIIFLVIVIIDKEDPELARLRPGEGTINYSPVSNAFATIIETYNLEKGRISA